MEYTRDSIGSEIKMCAIFTLLVSRWLYILCTNHMDTVQCCKITWVSIYLCISRQQEQMFDDTVILHTHLQVRLWLPLLELLLFFKGCERQIKRASTDLRETTKILGTNVYILITRCIFSVALRAFYYCLALKLGRKITHGKGSQDEQSGRTLEETPG